jgi:hypothetical protein
MPVAAVISDWTIAQVDSIQAVALALVAGIFYCGNQAQAVVIPLNFQGISS